ncbi:hypothetical protein ACM25O_14445 [Sulfitobacter pontiacus]
MTSDGDGDGGPKTSVDLSVGKEIDAAIGDVIRGLLKRPSEAVGDLFADGIGIFGDRVKRKREINAKLGMEEVRKKLDSEGVDMKDITPPKEEELHLLITGLSLTDDDDVRELWTGLFAKALEPDSDVMVERPFLSVLESLSPTDAKIIHFLAYASRELEAVAKKEKYGGPMFWAAHDPEMAAELQRRSKVIEDIEDQVGVLSLPSLEGGNFTDNLLRQGVIEIPTKSTAYWQGVELGSMEESDLARVLEEINEKVREIEETSSRRSATPGELYRVIRYAGGGADFQFQLQLSSFGRRLATACGIL